MSMDAIIRIEKSCGRKFSEEEAARLRGVGEALNIREDDAVWSLLAAMEYQRVFYEALPDRIVEASAEIMRGMGAAAERETAIAQAKLTNSVLEQAKRLPSKIQYATLLPMAMTALICLGLWEPDALGGLPHRLRTGGPFGSMAAHALRLAHQRAVYSYRDILRKCRGESIH